MSLPIYHFETVEQTGSTNSDLLERAFATSPQPPTALIAWHQTAGRGRRGRIWQSDLADAPLRGLTFSMAFERAADASQPLTALSLVLGICIAGALRAIYPIEAAALKVKWPNDLVIPLADGTLGKIGGILIETKRMGDVQRIVVGVGLNLFAPDVPTAQGAPAYRAHSLIRALDESTQTRRARLQVVTQKLCVAIIDAWTIFQRDGWTAFKNDWVTVDVFLNQAVTVVESESKQWSGQHIGLDEQGQLRVMTDCGERRVLVGDVSLRFIKMSN